MTVFDAFPRAVNSADWEIGQIQRATKEGDIYQSYKGLSVIVSFGTTASNAHASPDADTVDSTALLYCMPDELPTTDCSTLSASYVVKNTATGLYYDIDDANEGFNQETGELEHIELSLEPTEAVDG